MQLLPKPSRHPRTCNSDDVDTEDDMMVVMVMTIMRGRSKKM